VEFKFEEWKPNLKNGKPNLKWGKANLKWKSTINEKRSGSKPFTWRPIGNNFLLVASFLSDHQIIKIRSSKSDHPLNLLLINEVAQQENILKQAKFQKGIAIVRSKTNLVL
jgi:hypothetical protein